MTTYILSIHWCDVYKEAVGRAVAGPPNTSPWTELIEDYGGEYAMPLPADNPSSAAVWTQNEECISWRVSPHGAAETERQPCLITGPTNSTQSWWNTEAGVGQRTEVLGVFWCWGRWVRVCLTPKLWKTGTMRFCLDWRLCSFSLSCHCLPGFFLKPSQVTNPDAHWVIHASVNDRVKPT